MITVKEAEQIILAHTKDYGTELIPFEMAIGRVLAEDVVADRDLPSCNRSTMDGIAISHTAFEQGIRSFHINATIAAGDAPVATTSTNECVEIMTGAPLPDTTDTVIRYEDITIGDAIATINVRSVRKGQNIHTKGKDKQQGDTVARANQVIGAPLISIAASVGKNKLLVKKLPKIVIISTGDELVDVDITPTPYQVRRSNSYTIKAALQQYRIEADLLHIPDDPAIIKTQLKNCLSNYDVLLMTGGVSMGKFDYVPKALEELNVTTLFHKVQQRPGKPFWFGSYQDKTLIFAFPGNPISTFLCLHRYFIPWLENSLNISKQSPKAAAVLNEDVTFTPPLQYFMQVKIHINEAAQLVATPLQGNGSGDFANLLDTDAFMELPLQQSIFKKREVYPIWPFKPIV